jgi:hypothetical protein
VATIDVGTEQLPDRINVTVLAGKPFELTIAVTDNDGPLDGDDIASARAQVRQQIDGQEVWHTFSSENDPADIAISDDGLTITATSEQTDDWQKLWPGTAPETVMYWDVEIVDADDIPRQITLPGRFVVVHQVTR